jgi:hypothetical protein
VAGRCSERNGTGTLPISASGATSGRPSPHQWFHLFGRIGYDAADRIDEPPAFHGVQHLAAADGMRGRARSPDRSGRDTMIRRLMCAAAAFCTLSAAQAANLDGVSLPDVRVTNGTQMRLNGIGLRTYSILGIRIYIAGLYLERQNADANMILRSPEMKLLDIRFLRDVDAEDARKAWRDGFEQNCRPPCYLDPHDVQRFLAAVPSMHRGDESTLLFTSKGVRLTLNGQPVGDISDPHFAETILATFIGPEPPTPRLKRELLGFRD